MWFIAQAFAQDAPLPGDGLTTQPIAIRSADMRVIRRVEPVYPQAARGGAPGETICRVQVAIDDQGVPSRVNFVDCPEAFEDPTTAALLQWRWSPATMKGDPVKASVSMSVEYQLDPGDQQPWGWDGQACNVPVTIHRRGVAEVQAGSDVLGEECGITPLKLAALPDPWPSTAATCNMTLTVGADGKVGDVDAAGCTSHELKRAAEETLRRWHYVHPDGAARTYRIDIAYAAF
jgi:outer membrane biosynthesis protein TonB